MMSEEAQSEAERDASFPCDLDEMQTAGKQGDPLKRRITED